VASETWTEGDVTIEATWIDQHGHVIESGHDGATHGEVWMLDAEGRCLNRDYVITELGRRLREQHDAER
jgi:hypothetical protein